MKFDEQADYRTEKGCLDFGSDPGHVMCIVYIVMVIGA